MLDVSQAKKRILVVDDDPHIRDLICTRLDLAGYCSLHASDGFQALDRLRATRPAAMILDITMPELDGFGVLTRLKTMPAFRTLPIMVLTARHQTADVQLALGLGARDFLAKPFNDQVFLQRVHRLLRPPRISGQAN